MHRLSPWPRLGRAALVTLVVGLAATASAAATSAVVPSAAAEPPLAVRVLSPAPGQPLLGGETAVIAWQAEELPPGVEEWEAFLSLDGGAAYPFRVTPHLDRRITRFFFQVPSFPTTRARLLLRFGDERNEREVDAGFDLTIVPTPVLPVYRPVRVHRGAGEAARPGLEGTVAWVEGARDGSGLRQVIARKGRLSSTDSPKLVMGGGDLAAETWEPEPLPAGIRRADRGGLPRLAPQASAAARPPSLAHLDRLALLGRRNE